MSKFIYLYRGPARPMEEFTPEESAEQMAAWGEWMGRVQSAVTDPGAPFGARTALADDGTTPAPGDLNGYSIVEAESLEAAKALLDRHPFLSEGKGRFSIEVFELVPVEM
jgi:YCII-related domain